MSSPDEEAYRDVMAESAREVMKRASEEVHIREHDYLRPEHLLKAISELSRAIFDREVKDLNLEPMAVVRALDAKLAEQHETAPGCFRITAKVNGIEGPAYPAFCERVLFTALREAQKEGRLIESRDLLAALCKGGFSFVRELMEPGRAVKETEVLAEKIFDVITGSADDEGSEELQRLLKEMSEDVRFAALQEAASLAPPQMLIAYRLSGVRRLKGKSFAEQDCTLRCSFCGKSQKEVKKLIAGPDAYICNECIGIGNEIILDDLEASKR